MINKGTGTILTQTLMCKEWAWSDFCHYEDSSPDWGLLTHTLLTDTELQNQALLPHVKSAGHTSTFLVLSFSPQLPQHKCSLYRNTDFNLALLNTMKCLRLKNYMFLCSWFNMLSGKNLSSKLLLLEKYSDLLSPQSLKHLLPGLLSVCINEIRHLHKWVFSFQLEAKRRFQRGMH